MLPAELRFFRAPAYSYERYLEDRFNRVTRGPSTPERNIVLRDHQADAVKDVTRAKRIGRVGYLLADDVGLGKTFSAWKSVAIMPDIKTVLIVCPLAVAAAWRNAVRWMGDHGKIVVVINYDRLQKLFDIEPDAKGRIAKSLKAKARRGKAPSFDAIIFDEAHRLRNPTSARSKFSLKLSAKAKYRIWLSATAGQNPLELSYLSPLLAQMTGHKVSDLAEFEKWCSTVGLGVAREAFGKWVWSGSSDDIEKVRQLLFGGAIPAGLRRRPEDIDGWPEINRILMATELDADAAVLYEAAWREFRGSLGLDKTGARNSKNALVARLRYSQKSSLLRVPGTVAHILDLLDNGHQVAVSVAFQETLAAIKERLAGAGVEVAEIHGELGADDKEEQRLDFQTGRKKVVLFTVEEGISLHQGEYNDATRSEVIHDIRWSAIAMSQIEGRTHRDGKFSQIYWMIAPGTIDERIAEVVIGRIKTMKAMVGDDLTTVSAIEEALHTLGVDDPLGLALAA